MILDGTLLVDTAPEAVRVARRLSAGAGRDRFREVLDLFEIPSVAEGEASITYPDSMDEQDGPLLMTLLALFEGRFPLE